MVMVEQISNFIIRKVKYNELDDVMDINETTLPENYPKFFYEKIFEKFADAFLIAHPENDPTNIVGYIMWRVERGASSFNMKYIKKAHLVSIAVLQNYRQMKIGARLLNESMKIIDENYKVDEYILEVRVSNYPAIIMYENYNYERVKILDKYYRDNEDAYLMAKNVRKDYILGSKAMHKDDLKKYYEMRQMNGFVFVCPNCDYAYVKNIQWNNPNFIDKCYDEIFPCVKCKFEMKMNDIINSEYDP